MNLLRRYLKPQRKLVAGALVLAALSQVLALVDPIIFGWLVDDYANQRHVKSEQELVSGALRLLALAVGVAIASRACKAMQDYVTRLVVQRFGTQIFNDGLRQTLRLRYQEFEDQSSGETLSLVLEMAGCSTRMLHEGSQVLAGALDFGPDVILLDIGLPGMSGYEVAQRLRQEPRFARTLLVAITGWGTEQDRRRSQEAGFDHHLTKPVDYAALEPLLLQTASAR